MQSQEKQYPSFMEYVLSNVAVSAATGRHWVISALTQLRRSVHHEKIDQALLDRIKYVNPTGLSPSRDVREYVYPIEEVLSPNGLLASNFYSDVFLPAMQKVIGGAESGVFLLFDNAIQTMCNTTFYQIEKKYSSPFSTYANADMFMSELNRDVRRTKYTLTMLNRHGQPVVKNVLTSFAKGELIVVPMQEPGHWLMMAIRLVTSKNDPSVQGVPGPDSSRTWQEGEPRVEVHVLNSLSGARINALQRFCIVSVAHALVRATIRLKLTTSYAQEFPALERLTSNVCTVLYDSHEGQACQSRLAEGSGSICGVFVAAWIECMIRQMHMDLDGGPLDALSARVHGSVSKLAEVILLIKRFNNYGSSLLRYYYGLMMAYTLSRPSAGAPPYSMSLELLRTNYAKHVYPLSLATALESKQKQTRIRIPNAPNEILINACVRFDQQLCQVLRLAETDYEAFAKFRDEFLNPIQSELSKVAMMKAMQWHTQVLFANYELLNNVRFVESTLDFKSYFRTTLPNAVVATNNFTFAVAVHDRDELLPRVTVQEEEQEEEMSQVARTESPNTKQPLKTEAMSPKVIQQLRNVGAGLGAQITAPSYDAVEEEKKHDEGKEEHETRQVVDTDLDEEREEEQKEKEKEEKDSGRQVEDEQSQQQEKLKGTTKEQVAEGEGRAREIQGGEFETKGAEEETDGVYISQISKEAQISDESVVSILKIMDIPIFVTPRGVQYVTKASHEKFWNELQ